MTVMVGAAYEPTQTLPFGIGARLPFTDLLRMDRCPTLGGVRADPRFAEARAIVAARVVDLWGTVA